MSSNELVIPGNAARNPAYQQHLEMLRRDGECPFDEGVWQRLTPPDHIVHAVGGWVLKRARTPYPGAAAHLIMFPARHITTPAEFTDQDKLIAWELLDVAAEIGGADTGALAWRYSYSGNPADSGASIAHIHGHIVSAMEGMRVPINVGRVQPG